MNVLFFKETIRKRKQPPTDTVVVYEDKEDDSGRFIAHIASYADAKAIAKAMRWRITSDEFEP